MLALSVLNRTGHCISASARCVTLCCIVAALLGSTSTRAQTRALSATQPVVFDLTTQWDESIPLANPHKGWYHHYFDNGLRKYLPRSDEQLLQFPGMDHIYLRLAWSYLEPQEGQYNWAVIDRVIEKWTKQGLMVSFRISCKETGMDPSEQQFATPKWVMQAGAQGGYYRDGREASDSSFPWEPDFDDPVFLTKLDSFLRAFAQRYDGKPWLRYVDIGSLGDWGEGHTHSGSRKKYEWQARLKHLEMHVRHFRQSLLVVTDDFVRGAPTETGRHRLHQFVLDNGISYRDDSILVDYWMSVHGKTHSVANPEYFEAVYRKAPTVLELQHLRNYAPADKWEGRDGTPLAKHNTSGPEVIRGAIQQMRATYIGYHGPIDQWMALPENPTLSNDLLNICGYWYFPHRVALHHNPKRPKASHITIAWENRGVAPAYHPYKLVFRFQGPVTRTFTVDANNMRWLPAASKNTASDGPYLQRYRLPGMADLKPGSYELAIKLYCPQEERPVLLPLKAARKGGDAFYTVGSVTIP